MTITQTLNETKVPTQEQTEKAIAAILNVLGEPASDAQRQALDAFQAKEYLTVKRLASTNLEDYFIKALGYMGGALKLTPNTDTILAEAARSAADHAKARATAQLSRALSEALS